MRARSAYTVAVDYTEGSAKYTVICQRPSSLLFEDTTQPLIVFCSILHPPKIQTVNKSTFIA